MKLSIEVKDARGLLYTLITEHSIQKYEQQTDIEKSPTPGKKKLSLFTPGDKTKTNPKESQDGRIITEEEKAVGRFQRDDCC